MWNFRRSREQTPPLHMSTSFTSESWGDLEPPTFPRILIVLTWPATKSWEISAFVQRKFQLCSFLKITSSFCETFWVQHHQSCSDPFLHQLKPACVFVPWTQTHFVTDLFWVFWLHQNHYRQHSKAATGKKVWDGELKILWQDQDQDLQVWRPGSESLTALSTPVLRRADAWSGAQTSERSSEESCSPPHWRETLEMVWIKMPPGYLPLEVFQACPTGHCQAEPGHKGRLRSSIRSWRSWLGTKRSEPSSWKCWTATDAESWRSLSGELLWVRLKTSSLLEIFTDANK